MMKFPKFIVYVDRFPILKDEQLLALKEKYRDAGEEQGFIYWRDFQAFLARLEAAENVRNAAVEHNEVCDYGSAEIEEADEIWCKAAGKIGGTK